MAPRRPSFTLSLKKSAATATGEISWRTLSTHSMLGQMKRRRGGRKQEEGAGKEKNAASRFFSLSFAGDGF